MGLAAHTPALALRPHVRRAVTYAERCAGTVVETELPFAGAVALIVLGDPLEIDGRRVSSFASGIYDRPVRTARAGDQHLLQLDLTPLGARRLFGVPMGELANRVVDLDALLGGELAERVAGGGWDVLEPLLARRLQDAPAPPPEVELAYARIVATHGAVRVADLCARTGWSRRRLATTFRREIGVAPKTLARIARFERAHALLAAGADLADVALTCGFSDQPHFTHEVRDLAWTTPGALSASLNNVRPLSVEF